MTGKRKSRLKRHRRPGRDGDPIESRTPSVDDPVLRRYHPAVRHDVTRDLAERGVIDWRGGGPARGSVPVGEVENRIVCGDALASLEALPDGCATCVVTSPPYWNTVDYGCSGQVGQTSYEAYIVELSAVWKACERVLEPNGKLCINTPILPVAKSVMGGQHTRHLKNLNADIEASLLAETGLARFSLYVWQKQTTEKMFGSYPYPPNLFEQNTVEFIGVYVKAGKPKVLPREVKEHSRISETEWMDLTRQVWWLYPEDVKRANHPAPFPATLPNRLIAMYTFAACPGFAGDLVVDPFCGTAATCVAAKKLGRRWLGIDLSPDFCLHGAASVEAAARDGKIHTTARPAPPS